MVLGWNLAEGADAWTFASLAGDIAISYTSEDACRTIGARFGLGVSRLVDAAQWAMVAATYARRTLEVDMAYTGGPDEDRLIVESNSELAADAVGEALKFLPEGAEVVPDDGVWTEFGREPRARNPAMVTRAKLADDLE